MWSTRYRVVEESTINQLQKRRRISRELQLSAYIGDYDMDFIILYLGSHVNVLTKHTWERMGKSNLVWSPI